MDKKKFIGAIAGLIGLLILPKFLGNYSIFLLSMLAVYALVSIGLNLLMGFTGQIAAGHAGFLALGAYFTAILSAKFVWMPCLAASSQGRRRITQERVNLRSRPDRRIPWEIRNTG